MIYGQYSHYIPVRIIEKKSGFLRFPESVEWEYLLEMVQSLTWVMGSSDFFGSLLWSM